MTDRQKAWELLEKLRETGVQDSRILEHVLYNYLSGSDSVEALEDFIRDNFDSDQE
jgi:hypothetical protein